MYRIIGIDGKEYGPVTAERLKQWIAENRINAQTQILAEGTAEWKPLSAFPALNDLIAAVPPPIPTPRSPTDVAVSERASKKIAAGICGILLGTLGIHKFILGYTGAGMVMLLVSVLSCGIAGPVIHLIGLIEGIIYLTKSDEEFVRVYIDGRKEWF